MLNEISHVANKSNVTVASLQDFKHICSTLQLSDNNVEDYVGKYCFIEIGSSLPRLRAEVPKVKDIADENGKPYDGDSLYNKGQWFFSREHTNVLKLIFDDNQKFNNKFPSRDGFDGKTPTTSVRLSSDETRSGKQGVFYYPNGEDFTDDKAQRLKAFVDKNLKLNPNVKFIIHCMQGKSRSAAVGMYVSNKINQFNDNTLGEYDKDDGTSQFNIGMSKKGQPKYPHKNVMTRMGGLENWSNPKSGTKDQWFYNTLTNHPGSGYNAVKGRSGTVKISERKLRKMIRESILLALNKSYLR